MCLYSSSVELDSHALGCGIHVDKELATARRGQDSRQLLGLEESSSERCEWGARTWCAHFRPSFLGRGAGCARVQNLVTGCTYVN